MTFGFAQASEFDIFPTMICDVKKTAVLTLLVLCVGVTTSTYGQSMSGDWVLSQMYKRLDNMTSLQYSIIATDSLISGNVQVSNGHAALFLDRTNSEFPYKLYGKDSENNEFFFDGKQALYIAHNYRQFEQIASLHYRTFIGMPGGQMILPEFVLSETAYSAETGLGYANASIVDHPDKIVLTLSYPESLLFGIKSRIKILTIDKKTWLPVSCYHKLETTEGEKQVNIRTVTDIRLDDPSVVFRPIDASSLSTYSEIKRERRVGSFHSLLNNTLIDMTLRNIDGSKGVLSEKRGKVIMLVFWETWCGPCLESIPKVNALTKKYPASAFEVWGIASDEKTFNKLPGVVKRTGVCYPVYYGTEQVKKDYLVTAVPEYVIIDQLGKIIMVVAGFSEDIEKTLDHLLR